jgi:ABC-type transporter Mla MlaB component
MPAGIRADGDVLMLTGVIDFDSVPELLQDARALPAATFAEIDASGVTRIDSSGVAFLVWLKKHHGVNGRALTLRSAPGQLSSLLAVTGLGEVLDSVS